MEKDYLIALKEIFGFKYTGDDICIEMAKRVVHETRSPIYTNKQYLITSINGYILYNDWKELFRTTDINELLIYISTNLQHLRVNQPPQKLAIQDIIDE